MALTGVVASVFVFWFFGSMLVFPAAFALPALLTDWQVRGAALYVDGGATLNSSCTANDLLELCGTTLTAPVGAGWVERQVGYAFLSARGGRHYRVVADPAHPEWLSTDAALDVFWDRVACSTVAVLLLGLFGWVLARAGVRNYRRRRAWRRQDAEAAPLRLLSRQSMRGGQIWTVQGDDGPPETWTLPRKAEPFTLGSGSEVLGLRRLDGTAVMPLDSRLRWVDLTKAERALVLGTPKR